MKDYEQPCLPYKLVASAAPREQELETLEDGVRDNLKRIRHETRERIEQTLEKCKAEPPKILHEIPEMLELKWRETIAVFGADVSSYEALAEKLL